MTLDRLEYRTQNFDKHFNLYMKELLSKKEVIIVGDLNVAHKSIDLANP